MPASSSSTGNTSRRSAPKDTRVSVGLLPSTTEPMRSSRSSSLQLIAVAVLARSTVSAQKRSTSDAPSPSDRKLNMKHSKQPVVGKRRQPLACAAPAISALPNPFQQNTPLGLTALPTDTVEVTDPTHPLYGLSFPLIGVTVKQRLGRVCLVWLHPGIERAIPVSATSLASEPHVLVACRLSVAGLQTLLHVLSPLVCLNQEDAHEPAASTQLSSATPSSTALAVSRSRTDVVSSADPSGVFVSSANLGNLTPGHADGSQDHAAPRFSGGAQ
jgi:hypothetical protein